MLELNEKQRLRVEAQKERVRKKVYAKIDPTNYEFIPENKRIDYYSNDVAQNVAVYARVSTGSIQQTSSYELQKKYYEDFVVHHPNWNLKKIYADEGISGTSLAHRDEFNKMISDCKSGKVDMIITKSVSRFSRNVVDCIGIVRMLAELPHPVGVFFESECIFSLNDDSQMALSFQATMAQEESHTRSRSMESSLRMRLDGGLPLTPKLLGYSHDSDGLLVINPNEAPTVKLIFYMYLYGYSTSAIAEELTKLGKKTYLGNVKWTSNAVVGVLRNERHCGDVRTRKTFTPNYLNHKSKKNRGDRPQSVYRNHHDAIVSRDDYIAVQRLLDNAKYGSGSILPELRIIENGLLKGFIIINPRWAGFKPKDYYRAAASIDPMADRTETNNDGHERQEPDIYVQVAAGDFDMRDFEITRREFFDTIHRPYITFQDKKVKLSMACVRQFDKDNSVELLVNPIDMRFAVRTASKDSRNATMVSKATNGIYYPKGIAATAYFDTIFQLLGWDTAIKYRAFGSLFRKGDEAVYIFDTNNAESFVKLPAMTEKNAEAEEVAVKPLSVSGSRVRAVPQEWMDSFGHSFYVHQHVFLKDEVQDERNWKIRLEGRLFETGRKLNITAFDELKHYIGKELGTNVSGGMTDE